MELERLLGVRKTEDEVMDELKINQEVYRRFQKLSNRLQQEFVEFSMGMRSLNISRSSIARTKQYCCGFLAFI